MNRAPNDVTLLLELLRVDSPSGDEGPMADWLDRWVTEHVPDARLYRTGDNILAVRGTHPAVAVFSHIDTTGFTLGYDKKLIPIGGPAPKGGDAVKVAGRSQCRGTVRVRKSGDWVLNGNSGAVPGDRCVYASTPEIEDGVICAPYLDNRAGIYAALRTLQRCSEIVVAFTVGEEHSGNGALVCGNAVYSEYGITHALVCDITWDTDHIKCGRGVAISLRDRMVPRRRYLDTVLRLAQESGVPYQREIESAGGSDGAYLQRSGLPIDWVFVGAPEVGPHTAREKITLSDLDSMIDLLSILVCGLHKIAQD